MIRELPLIAKRPESLTGAFLVFVPHQTGFYAGKLDVLKLSLASFMAHTSNEHDLLVFDNGSCSEVREYLRELRARGSIDILIESRSNIGKLAALRAIFAASPGEVVAFADEDVFFYPGWAEKQLELLHGFPRVAMVSGCAVRTSFEYGLESALKLAQNDPAFDISRGQRISDDREAEWAASTGRDPKLHVPSTRDLQDVVLHHHQKSAFVAANHFQFMAPKRVLLPFLDDDWSGRLMGGIREFENQLVAQGYLRLATLEKTTRHIGNMLSRTAVAEASQYGLQVGAEYHVRVGLSSRLLARLLEIRRLRGALRRVYYWLYWNMQAEQ